MTSDTAPAAGETAPRGRRRWVRGALIVSLALNLLFIGLIAGGLWLRWNHPPRYVSFSGTAERMLSQMPPERRTTAAEVLARYRDEVRPMWRRVGAARREMVEAMRAEPFDEARARAALEQLNAAHIAARARLGDYMLQFVAQLTPEERQAFIKRFDRRR